MFTSRDGNVLNDIKVPKVGPYHLYLRKQLNIYLGKKAMGAKRNFICLFVFVSYGNVNSNNAKIIIHVFMFLFFGNTLREAKSTTES